MIYLDHAATSPLLPEVKHAMKKAMDEIFGNASSLHTPGHSANQAIEDARLKIAKLINANPEEIIFTSGGSESNNTVIRTFANKDIVVSAIEHPSILKPTKKYAKNCIVLPVNQQGEVIFDDDISADLFSIMLANNELGTIEPIQDLSKKVHNKKSYIHTDATQAIGKIPVDVKKLDVDYLTFNAHKIGGPTGIGVLYVKNGAPFEPLMLGGHQEKGRRAGSYDTISVIGFGVAAELASKPQKDLRNLRDLLAKRISEKIPHSSINTPLENSIPSILNVSFEAAEGESIQLYLDLEGIAVSTGSACASGDGKPSHVLMAAHHDAEVAHSSIRFSLSNENTKEDIDKVMEVLPKIIERLQKISTIKIKGDKK